MSEQNHYKPLDTNTPEMQDLVMSVTIGGIAYELSQRLHITPSLALDLFYRSRTCQLLHNKKTGLYLMSNGYVADDFITELRGTNK